MYKKIKHKPPTTHNRPLVGETLTQRTFLTKKPQQSKRLTKEAGGEHPVEGGNKNTGGAGRDGWM